MLNKTHYTNYMSLQYKKVAVKLYDRPFSGATGPVGGVKTLMVD